MIRKLFTKIFRRKPFGAPQPKVLGAAQHGIDRRLASSHAVRVCETLQKSGFRAYIVGGAVRDLLLGIRPKDFDVATDAPPEAIQKLFRRARIIGRRFRLVHVMFGSETIEVSTFRALHTADSETDEHGRVLRDNVFGEQFEDATRRDFTVNALYYDPQTETVLDYHQGVRDIRDRIIRIVGEPVARYREDPVRMLRAVRFAAKLKFEIDPATREPIAGLARLIENVPSARLFDEMLKLLQSGSALACLTRLRQEGLQGGLFPLLDAILDQTSGERFIEEALSRTDDRVHAGKPISPGFLFASLLWHLVLSRWNARKAAGELQIPALFEAMDDITDRQLERLAIPRRITTDMREIWSLQPRFEKRNGKAPLRLTEHPRFRAGLDFLELRAATGDADPELAQWWRLFYETAHEGRDMLLSELSETGSAAAPRKRRRRRKPADGVQPDTTSAGDAVSPAVINR
ncbi:MAG: polynucleotide adenylyltransferase PcnB [Burkholderiaceae bacterium]|jgi:poly(A) polymerase